MSRATSATTGRRYGLKRVCGTWERSRSALYARRARLQRPERGDGPARRGPTPALSDAQLLAAIRSDLARSPFQGEGHRKVHARLRILDRIRVSRTRVLREQPRRGFASTDATARATDAPVQIRGARAAVSLGPRTRAESLPGRATSASVGAPPLASDAGVRRMGCGDVCLLNDEGYRAIKGSSRPPLINLTVPRRAVASPGCGSRRSKPRGLRECRHGAQLPGQADSVDPQAFAATPDRALRPRHSAWINPHSWIHIDVTDENGNVESWAIECGAPNALIRRGLNKNSVPAGTELVVDGFGAKDGSNTANARDITLPDGSQFYVGSSGTGAPGQP